MSLGKRYGVNIKTISKRWIKDFVLWAMGDGLHPFSAPMDRAKTRRNSATIVFPLGGGRQRPEASRARHCLPVRQKHNLALVS